jgi:AraC-like DNA-binding protein
MAGCDKRIQLALSLLINSDTDTSVAHLSESAGLSPSRFSQLFYRATGMLPDAFLQMIRRFREEHEVAANLLANTRLRLLLSSIAGRELTGASLRRRCGPRH